MTQVAERIKGVCGKQYTRSGSVLPPTVCPYCMGCPLGALFSRLPGPAPIPEKHKEEVLGWLSRREAKEDQP